MIKKIKAYILTMSTALMLLMPIAATTAIAHAGTPAAGTPCTGVSAGVQSGVNAATNSNGSPTTGGIGGSSGSGQSIDCSSTGVNNDSIKSLAAKITNIFSIIVGAASVIMIIYGGFRYIISGGESGRVGAAKNSLIYAIVGLVIVALAQLIIHFVLSQASTVGS